MVLWYYLIYGSTVKWNIYTELSLAFINTNAITKLKCVEKYQNVEGVCNILTD